jgi:hypothetical protein
MGTVVKFYMKDPDIVKWSQLKRFFKHFMFWFVLCFIFLEFYKVEYDSIVDYLMALIYPGVLTGATLTVSR